MPAPTKFVFGYALLAKLEASYNAGGSLAAATDAVLLEEHIRFKPSQYANDGARPAPPGTVGYQRRTVPSGRFAPFPAKVAPKGAGAAYSASVVPTGHALLRASGLDGAVTTTGGLEKWDYTPSPIIGGGYGSNVIEIYGRGQKYPFTGVLGDWTFGFKAGEIPALNFAMQGLQGAVSDVAYSTLSTLAYPNSAQDPPKAVNVGFTWNGIASSIIRELTIKYGRKIGARLDANVGGHAGFGPGSRTPTMEITIEAPALATADYFNAFDTAVGGAWTFTIGTVQYNRYTILGPLAQLMAAPEEDEDAEGVSLLKLAFQLNPSSILQNDELTWRYN
jgi:hypothetical protein